MADTQCNCRRCIRERADPNAMVVFVTCKTCGNKRCPRANDHRHACTGSNEPGQKGSDYEVKLSETPDEAP